MPREPRATAGVRSSIIRLLIALALAAVATLQSPTTVSAHTGFESSEPADQTTVSGPLQTIRLVFSGVAAPAGEGFVVLDADGTLRSPDTTTSSDGLVWELGFATPLPEGATGVRWSVAAPDTHPIEGSFSFTIAATAVATTTTPATEEETPNATAGSSAEPASADQPAASDPTATADDTLDDFLAAGRSEPALVPLVKILGRLLNVAGSIVGIGAVVFARTVVRGRPSDTRTVLFWIRRAGMTVMVASIVLLAGHLAGRAGQWRGVWSPSTIAEVATSSIGVALALRLVGGALLGFGTSIRRGEEAPAAGSGPTTVLPALGALFVLISFSFDGHTVSEGPRWLHALADVAHVGAASVWAGGVLMLAATAFRRRQEPGAATGLAASFSVVAAIAVTIAGIAGIALSAIILDDVTELWSTPWGRIVILKVVVVSAAAAAGAYNHFVLLPALAERPRDAETLEQLRATLVAEATAMGVAIVLTAFLVGATS